MEDNMLTDDPNYFPLLQGEALDRWGIEESDKQGEYLAWESADAMELDTVNQDMECLRRLMSDLEAKRTRLKVRLGIL